MSAIATFTLLPQTSLSGLRDAAIPKKSWLGKPKDRFHDYLTQHGRSLSNYDWSGYILATLLVYLQENKNVDLMKSDFDDLGAFLAKARRCTAFFLTNAHRESYLQQLLPEAYTESDLKTYFESFNETESDEAGKAMLDGISVFHESLSQVTPKSAILFTIG